MMTRAIHSALPPRHRCRGQALVLALVLLLVGSLGLIYLFSAGQTAAAKQRAVNAADAAAYSAAVWRARTLNYQAYANRAIIAQEVAIAQAVTLASWSQYFETFIDNVSTIVAIVFPVSAPAVASLQQLVGYAQDAAELAARTEIFLRGAERIGYKNLLADSQQLMHAAGGPLAMSAVANEVARLNHPRYFAFALGDNSAYAQLTRLYESDDDRRRLQRVVLDSLDRFVTDRPGNIPLPLLSHCVGGGSLDQWVQWFRKRGGTAMSSLERWEAADTLSIHTWFRSGTGCRSVEITPIGWGATEASRYNTGRIETNPGDVEANGQALEEAESEILSFDSYSGITRVRDLNYDALDNPRFPTSPITVLLQAPPDVIRTARQAGSGSGRLQLDERLHGGQIWAVAAADVYFRRPADAPPRVEYASLYSPYWQARLREPSDDDRLRAEGYGSR